MLQPEDIRTNARQLWDSGRVLRAQLGLEEGLFPWGLLLAPLRGGSLLEEFAPVQDWKSAIEAGCKCVGGEGYRIDYLELEHRQSGLQRLPSRVVFDTPMDLAGYLGKTGALGEFARISREIRRRHPGLRDWIEAHPMQVLERAEDWPRLLAVLDGVLARPRPNPSLDELSIPGVDDGFVENHKRLLGALLERLLPRNQVPSSR
jgi:hypothetical protein